MILLGICLIACTITRQFPTFLQSKKYFFQKEKTSFQPLAFFVQIRNVGYITESLVTKIQQMHFYTYQKGPFLYAYKGLIGRISPILVHFSLILILGAAGIGAFQNMKAQEVITKGELFHIQNPIRMGFFTSLPTLTTRVNDFWVEYQNNQITKEFEAEKIKICLEHFQLPSDDDYVIYWMLNSEEVKMYEQEPFSKN